MREDEKPRKDERQKVLWGVLCPGLNFGSTTTFTLFIPFSRSLHLPGPVESSVKAEVFLLEPRAWLLPCHLSAPSDVTHQKQRK